MQPVSQSVSETDRQTETQSKEEVL